MHPKVVSERLGHSGVSITLDLYSHVTGHLQAEAAELVAGPLLEGLDDEDGGAFRTAAENSH